jgi:hypothetical protein
MSGNCNGCERQRPRDGCIDGDKALDASFHEQMGIGFEYLLVVTMIRDQKKEPMLPKMFFDATNHHGAVGIPDLCDYSDGECALYAQ